MPIERCTLGRIDVVVQVTNQNFAAAIVEHAGGIHVIH
jgi:hypothetical protein